MKKNYLFGMLLLLSVAAIGQIPTNGLVGYYRFSGNVTDGSGNGNNGTLNNGALFTADRFGNNNSAVSLDGVNDYVALPSGSATTLNITGDFSVSFWIKTTDNGLLASMGDNINLNSGGYLSGTGGGSVASGKLGVGIRGSWNGSSVSVIDNIWHNVVYLLKADTMRIYIDNNLDAQFTGIASPLSWSGNRVIGCRNDLFMNAASNFAGIFDDLLIYNRALTETEISTIFNDCSAPAAISAYGPTSFCSGSNVLLLASPTNASYQWTKAGVNIAGATNISYTATTGGSYRCVVSCGASTSTSNAIALTKLANASVTVSASGSTTFCAGGNTTITATNPGAGYAYQWYRGNISINGATSLSYVAANPGAFKIITTNTSNNCSRMSAVITTVVNCRMANPTVFAGSVEQQNNLVVYPNPSAGSFTIQLNEATEGMAKIELRNLSGQKVYETTEQMSMGEFEKSINFGSKIPVGFYILRVTVKDRSYESKVVVN